MSVGDVVEINEVCKFHMNIQNASQVGSHLQNGMVCKINVHCKENRTHQEVLVAVAVDQ